MVRKLFLIICLLTYFEIFSQKESFFYGSIESNSIYYDENEDNDYLNKLGSNNYLNLKYIHNSNWNIEAQIESYLPKRLQNYSQNFEETHLSTLSFNYQKNGFNFTIGSVYDQFGSGLALRTWEDRQLGINNSILGIKLGYSNQAIDLKLIAGKQKKGTKISSGKLIGFDSSFIILSRDDALQNLTFGMSYVGRYEELPTTNIFPPINYDFDDLTNLFSGRIDYLKSDFYLSYEQVFKSKDGVILMGNIFDDFIKKGKAHYLNFGVAKQGFGFDFTFRRLENMGFYTDRLEQGEVFNELTINYLPALTKQHDYSLSNINVYESQPYVSFPDPSLMKSGEIGFQMDLYFNIKENTFLGGKYGTNLSLNLSSWYNLDGEYSYNPLDYKSTFLSFGERYFTEQSLEIRKKWNTSFNNIILLINKFYNNRFIEEKTGESNSQIIVIDNNLTLKNDKSLRFEIQHLFDQDDKKNWYGYGFEYSFNYNFSMYFNNIVNYENIEQNKPSFYSFGASYSKNSSLFSISYGKQRGGLLCYGGICRYVPEFKGLSFSINTTF